MEANPVHIDGVVDNMLLRPRQRRQAQLRHLQTSPNSQTGAVVPPQKEEDRQQKSAGEVIIDLTSDIPDTTTTNNNASIPHHIKSTGTGMITSVQLPPAPMAYRRASISHPTSFLPPIVPKSQSQQQKSIKREEKSSLTDGMPVPTDNNNNNNNTTTNAPQPNKAALQAVIHGMGHAVHRVGSMEPPDGTMSVDLMPHQRQALAWMYKREARTSKPPFGGILADDQGLGKTVSTIALIMTAPPDLRREEQQARQAAFSAAALGNTRKEQAMRKKLLAAGGSMDSVSSDSAEEATGGGGGDTNSKRKRAALLAASSSSLAYGATTECIHADNNNDNDTNTNQHHHHQHQQPKPKKRVIHGGTLIICPTSVINQWAEELNAKVSPSANLSVHIYHGKNKSMSEAALAQFDVVLTTYATLSLDSPPSVPPSLHSNGKANNNSNNGSSGGIGGKKRTATNTNNSNGKSTPVVIDLTKNNKLLPLNTTTRNGSSSNKLDMVVVNDSKITSPQDVDEEYKGGPLFQLTWHRVVLDEAQIIKNARTQGAQATWKLKARRRWCLSGTPIQNTIDDLYSLFRFLRYDPYDNVSTFKSLISNPISSGDPHAFKRLQAVLNGVLLRRTKDSKIDGVPIVELPEKKHKAIQVEFSPEERAFYDTMYNQAIAVLGQLHINSSNGGGAPNYANMLWLLLRLRQACNHPALLRGSFSSKTNNNGKAPAALLPDQAPGSSNSAQQATKQKQRGKATTNSAAIIIKNQIAASKKLPPHLLESMTSALTTTQVQCVVCGDVSEHASVSICTHMYCEECLSSQFGAHDTYGDIEPGVCPAFDCLACGNTLTPNDVFFAEALRGAGCGDDNHSSEGKDGAMIKMSSRHPSDGTNGTNGTAAMMMMSSRHPSDGTNGTNGTAAMMMDGQNPFILPSSLSLSLFTSSSKVVALMKLLRKIHGRPEEDGDGDADGKGDTEEEEAVVLEEDEDEDEEDDMQEIDLSDIDEDNYAEYKHRLTKKQRKKLKKKFRKRKRSRSASYGGGGSGGGGNSSKRQDKIIVFSQWTGMLDLIQTQVQQEFQCRRLDGSMSVAQRSAAISDFSTDPSVTILLVSLKAAALGLNLITANHVVLVDLWWNPTVEDQAIDRTHRIGQKREVQVYRITVKESIEDNILKLQEKKRDLVQAALGCEGADGSVVAGRLTMQDIMFLFSNSSTGNGGGGGGE